MIIRNQGLVRSIFILTFFVQFISYSAQAAGNKTGNGGGAWICRASDGTILWGELVDIYEAEHEFGLTLDQFSGSVQQIVDQVTPRISTPRFVSALNALPPYIEKLNYLNAQPPLVTYVDSPLDTIDDALYSIIPPASSCLGGSIQYAQVVNYHYDGTIEVQEKLFSSLSTVSKAALILHEGVYAFRRATSGDVDSVVTRKIIGLAFSNIPNIEFNFDDLYFDDGVFQRLKYQLPPGSYKILTQNIDASGNFLPISGLHVELSALSYPQNGAPRAKWDAITDDSGEASIASPSNGFGVFPQMSIELAGAFYTTEVLLPEGWGSFLRTDRKELDRYSCEAVIARNPSVDDQGLIYITCVDDVLKN